MDKFDEIIKHARADIAPSARFVDDTMHKIMREAPSAKRNRGFMHWLPLAAGAAAVIAVVFAFSLHGGKQAPSTGTSTLATTSPGIAAGSDNASLAGDLSSVQSSLNQESTDQNSANQAINDQQQEIAVPTN